MSPPTTPTTPTSPASTPQTPDSIFTRLIWTPLLAISFIISLVVADYGVDRAVHGSSSPSSSSAKHTSSTESDERGKGQSKKDADEEARYYRYKKRKLAKLEMGRALEMRRTVLVLLLIGIGVTVWGLGYLGLRAWDLGLRYWRGENLSFNLDIGMKMFDSRIAELAHRFGWK